MKTQIWMTWILMCVLVLGLAAVSQAMKVGLLGAELSSGFVAAYLETQFFAAGDLTYIDTVASTPSTTDMAAFDAVLVWTNLPTADSTLLGNNLAD
jgi:hypothetical protein